MLLAAPTPTSLGQQPHHAHSEQLVPPEPDRAVIVPREDVGRRFVEPPPVPNEMRIDWPGDSSEMLVERQAYQVEDLVTISLQNNPTLRQSRLHISAQLASAMQAGLYPNPVFNYVGEQIGIDVPGDKDSPGEWQGAEIQQRIVTAGKLRLSRAKYLQRARVAEHLAVAQQFRVANDVRLHFARTLAAQQKVSLREELLKTAEDHLVTSREMYNLGQASRADIHQANAMLQQHRLKLMLTQNELRKNRIQLASLVGIELDGIATDGELDSTQSLIDFDSVAAILLTESPELLAARAKLREDCITLNREQVEWVPDLVVSGGSGYNFDAKETTAAAGIGVEIPLYDRNQGTIQQARADYYRQVREIRRLELELKSRLADEYHRYLTAYQHVANFREVVLPEKREAYRLLLGSYKSNRAEWPDVLHAQEGYTKARIAMVEHQLSLRSSEIQINGYLLHGGLDAAPGPLPGGHIDSVPKPR